MELKSFFILFISFFTSPHWIWSLKLTGTRIPYFGVLHRKTTLDCYFDLENDKLYAVKWYKDGHEFFRFNPKVNQPITAFPVDGVFVNENLSSLHRVHLENITLRSAGEYRCEVSADAPTFQTLSDGKYMRIMVLPQNGPTVTGIYPWYNVGDNFTAHCSLTQSYPEAKLNWFVNDAQIDEDSCACVTFKTVGSRTSFEGINLYNSTTGLKFPIDSNYFRDGTISIECRASFHGSTIVLQDLVITSVKTGLGLQYADSLSKSIGNQFSVGNLWNFLVVGNLLFIILNILN